MTRENGSPNSISPDENIHDKNYWEAKQNLIGFFDLLLKIDKRVNPHLYKEIETMPEKEIKKQFYA